MIRKLVLVPLAIFTAACGSSADCVLHGDNVKGHVIFTESEPATANQSIVIQVLNYGTTTVQRSETVRNSQGLIAVPYSVCADTNTDFQVQAFVDANENGSWQTGEATGRDDELDLGHTSHIRRNIEGTTSADGAATDWQKITDVNIWIDDSTAQ